MCGGAAGHPHVRAAQRHTHPAAATPSQRRVVDLLWRQSHVANINEKMYNASSAAGTCIVFMQECNLWQYYYLQGTHINRPSHLPAHLARLRLPCIYGWGLRVGMCVGSISFSCENVCFYKSLYTTQQIPSNPNSQPPSMSRGARWALPSASPPFTPPRWRCCSGCGPPALTAVLHRLGWGLGVDTVLVLDDIV